MSSMLDQHGAASGPNFFKGLMAVMIGGSLLIVAFLKLASVLLKMPFSDFTARLAPVWSIILSPLLIFSLTISTLVIMILLLLIGKRRRLRFISNFLVFNVLLAYGTLSYFFFLAVMFTFAFQGVPETTNNASKTVLGSLILAVPPLLCGMFLWRQIRTAMNLEIRKAYEAAITFTEEYRETYIENNHKHLLANEDAIILDWQRKASPLRIYLMEFFWYGAEPLDTSRMHAYHQEQLLMLKLAKAQYTNTATSIGGMSMSRRSGSNVSVPETFDLALIEQRLLQYRFDKPALSSFITGVLDRFKSWEHRKRMIELFKQQDLAVEYHGKVYAVKAAAGQLSLLDLDQKLRKREKERDISKVEADIAEEKRRKRSAEQPSQTKAHARGTERDDAEDSYAKGLRDTERRETYHYDVLRIRDRIRGAYDKEKATALLRELDELQEEQEGRINRIENSRYLSPDEKKVQLHKAAQAYIKALDDFAARNGIE